MASQPTHPIAALENCYLTHIERARRSIETGLKLSNHLRHPEFATRFQELLDTFDATAVDLLFLINEANETAREDIQDQAVSFGLERPTQAVFGGFR